MTDHLQNPDDPISNALDPERDDHIDDDDENGVEAVFIRRRTEAMPDDRRDPYDLEWLFVCWSWEAGYRNWNDGLRTLVRALRGLEKIGLIERRRIQRGGRATHHGFVLTDDGRDAVAALSGDWIQPSEH